jgi:hypothetical protein
MPIFKDEYVLDQSQAKSISSSTGTIRLDLVLKPNPYLRAGTIAGRVVDTSGSPIGDAVVVILDGNYNAVAHSLTSSSGSFSFTPIEAASDYRVFAKAPGYLCSEALVASLKPNQTLELTITLVQGTPSINSIIIGQVYNEDKLPVPLAALELYKVEDSASRLISLTFSNEIGQFIFNNLELGSYFIKINAHGYMTELLPAEIMSHHSMLTVEARLKVNPKASLGVVTGLITNTDDQPLSNADVILYRVSPEGTLTPVDFTRTNHEGIYLFVNVPPGEYRVNSIRTVVQ